MAERARRPFRRSRISAIGTWKTSNTFAAQSANSGVSVRPATIRNSAIVPSGVMRWQQTVYL